MNLDFTVMSSIWNLGGETTLGPLLTNLVSDGFLGKSHTVVKVLNRLIRRGMLSTTNGSNPIYTAQISEMEFHDRQTRQFILSEFNGDVFGLFASLDRLGYYMSLDLSFLNKGGRYI